MNLMPSSRILIFALTIVAIFCFSLLGYRIGVDARQPGLAAALPDGSTADVQQQVAIDRVTRERDVARETVRQLQSSLADAERLADDDRAELDLYRRIASDSTPSGLSIDNVSLEGNALAITLIQSRGRKSVNGIVQVALTRSKGDQIERLLLPASSGETDIGFDFRFFETIELPIAGLDGFPPQQLEIEVRPSGEAYKAFKAEFPWEEVIR